MTQSKANVAKSKCAWCGRPFEVVPGPGRPRRFCRDSCRQREYEQRRRAGELGLNEDELIITREELELIKDRLFVLQCALEDVDNADDDLRDRAVAELLDAARAATK